MVSLPRGPSSIVQCSAVLQWNAVKCSVVQFSAVQRSVVKFSAVQSSAVKFSAVHCSLLDCFSLCL